VLLVRRALAVGFTLNEMAGILQTRDRGGVPCRQVRELADRKLADLEARLLEMEALRRTLQTLLKDWDKRLTSAVEGDRAGLLETQTMMDAANIAQAHAPTARSQSWRRQGTKKRSHEE
jgi:hypothetical protein